MSTSFLNNERLTELLAQRATEGLNASERTELERLLAQYPDAEAEWFEHAASALFLASTLEQEPLPTALKDRLIASADAFVAPVEKKKAAISQLNPPTVVQEKSSAAIAWFAAAACLVLAVIAWWPAIRTAQLPDQTAKVEEPHEVKVAKEREQLASRPTAIQRTWTNTGDPNAGPVSGDIVWDNEKQQGYMRFHGLAANDKSKAQYQLWIFDGTRSDKYPVDGGVFDIPNANGDVIVPIKPMLPVRDPAMFAVTLEKPGGVVVSEREHILVLAKVAAG